ncbi:MULTISPECIES: hypothetical protein [unclassified Frondihabitans]|uniref:hypothetical protein n=1 Tax=unclassified Frondihabitans TaxID=2626248 RepID=UPI0006F69A35|nr:MULTISPECIES: hypothetical protein [unclassified Frondihabitans]KQQ28737.1 hypothetical protein ASF54_08880 [Frondihabitans sp. Leaf304]MBF4575704.1 hypothetical protein [Frondihabitans sp. VKM Ac-2883]RPE78242.1 hypothetical protein EDF37_0914 [Frondihabitans sp. PhB153]RPF08523.1 hypothetical protein EDF39_0916 [Frondihabitans sp. PhB161]
MSFTRTVTVIDHEVVVRTVEVPDEAPAQTFTAITGGRRTAAFTAAGGLFVIALALMPAVTAAFH